ncbi:MAG TPA: prepilin-type N-terminal cleavage/methylation domain-containing protein [Candidatus Aminicenantes bacterium]|nr:prepilin-type N-terminal cleavage/methylation domain-containing protein [Candidatus Aminicenantes bacterium]
MIRGRECPGGCPARIRRAGGFTLLETLVTLAIIGILTVIFYPSVKNSFEMRSFDNASRDILTTLQVAKWQAVNTKYFHRVRFAGDSAGWTYRIEIEKPYGTWTLKQGQQVKRIPSEFGVTLTLPADLSIVFDGTGFVSGFDTAKNQISLSSSRLALLGEPHYRTIRFYASGSTQFIKGSTG